MNDNQKRWQERYETGETPWDTNRPDGNLVRFVETGSIRPCKVLDVGCGTGTNALWLQEKGFSVTGIDISSLAIEKALIKNKSSKNPCDFICGNIFEMDVPGAPFDLVFDRGCFHTFDDPAVREGFAERVSEHLKVDGMWLSFVGSCDGPPRAEGPPRRSAQEVARAVEPEFELLSMANEIMDSDRPVPPRMWICFMRKRTRY